MNSAGHVCQAVGALARALGDADQHVVQRMMGGLRALADQYWSSMIARGSSGRDGLLLLSNVSV